MKSALHGAEASQACAGHGGIDLTKHGIEPDTRGADVSPDGKSLFFSVHDDLWWVDIRLIERLRPRR